MIFGLLLFCHGMAHRSDSPSSRALPLCLETNISFFHFFFFFTSFTHLCILHLVMLGGSGGWLSGMRRNPLHTWWEVLFWVIYIDFFSLLFISPFVRLTPSPDSEARSPHSVL